ncbi:MAG: hypothetical protein JSU70_16075 [Phycisphaerales bacterium]|nr:MAG: hypothetical protein JSU70_16075 [Phycisphaerales bacterium]
MKDNEKCGQCRFFVPEKAEDGKGECRRHSPRPGPSFQIGGKDVGREPRWPEVDADCCCGEFEREVS